MKKVINEYRTLVGILVLLTVDISGVIKGLPVIEISKKKKGD